LPGQPAPDAAVRPLRKSYVAMFDREGNYWNRWAKPGMALPEPLVRDVSTLGLTKTVFEDREGNLWLSEVKPVIHRLRHPSMVRIEAPGLTVGGDTSAWMNIALDSRDHPWIATMVTGNGTDAIDGVWAVTERFEHVQKDELQSATAIARDAAGAVWIGGRGGIWKLHEGRFRKALDLPEPGRASYVETSPSTVPGDFGRRCAESACCGTMALRGRPTAS